MLKRTNPEVTGRTSEMRSLRSEYRARVLPIWNAPVLRAALLLVSLGNANAQPRIDTFAGGWLPTLEPALTVPLGKPLGLAADSAGNLYFSSDFFHAVFKLDRSSSLTRVAGTGLAGFSGDGANALIGQLANPAGLALDPAGNLYIADSGNKRIRRVNLNSGVISTFAGNGSNGFSGDNGPATAAGMTPYSVALDSSGAVYVGDGIFGSRVRRIDAQTGIITTLAGNNTHGYAGDNGPAKDALLDGPRAICVDDGRNVYIADQNNNRVRRIDARSGIITTVAGNGTSPTSGDFGDNGPARSAAVPYPQALALDGKGNLYIANYSSIRRVSLDTERITTVAGSNQFTGYSGDGGSPASALLAAPSGIVTTDDGRNLIVADTVNNRIRQVDFVRGTISTVAGNGYNAFRGENELAIGAVLEAPWGLATSKRGDLFIADKGNHRIRRVNLATAIITTVAGYGGSVPGNQYTGDGGPAIIAGLTFPGSSVVDDQRQILYIADTGNSRIRAVDLKTGIISLMAGNGNWDSTGDGGPATKAGIRSPNGLALDTAGNLYLSDTDNHRVRYIETTTGTIRTIAGNGVGGFGGDGGLATSASLDGPDGLTVDQSGKLYIADTNNHRIRCLDSTKNTITTIAGTGRRGYGGDAGPALLAALDSPHQLAIDSRGDLYIADTGNSRVRRVNMVTGIITTVAGNGSGSFNGDGGPAEQASVSAPVGLVFDTAGNLYITDFGNDRVRRVAAAPSLTLSSNAVSFSSAGSQSVSVGSSGTTLSFTASAGTSSGGSWLSVAPSSGSTPATLTVSVNSSGLVPGSYTGTVTVNAPNSANNPQTVSVTLTVPNPVSLTISPSTLTFTAAGSQTVALGSNGTALSFNAAVSGGSWLSVSPASGTTPVNLRVSVAPGNLSPGTYSGTITVTAANAANSPQTVSVQLTVPTVLSANPPSLTLNIPEGSGVLVPQVIQISTANQDSSYSVAPIADKWLSTSTAAGSLPVLLQVQIDPTGLAAGNYPSKIVVQSSSGNKIEIPVTLTITRISQPTFDVDAPSLKFTVGGSNPQLVRVMLVTSRSSQNMSVSLSSKQRSQWLEFSPATVPLGPAQSALVQVRVRPAQLPGGLLNADTIVVSASSQPDGGPAGQAQEVSVLVSISTDVAVRPLFSTTGITLYTLVGPNNRSIDERDFLLYNDGTNPLDWAASEDSNTIHVTPSFKGLIAPGKPQPLTVTTTENADFLKSPQTQINFRFAGLDDPGKVSVYIQAMDRPSLPPRPNTSGVILGPPGFEQATVRIQNTQPAPAKFEVTPPPSWLAVTPSSGQVPGSSNGQVGSLVFTLLPNRAPNPGEPLTASVQFTDYFGKGNHHVVNIDAIYASPPAATSTASRSIAALQPSAAACKPSRLSAVFASPGNLFAVPAALPVDLGVRIVDDCGAPLASGAAVVTFSSGEPGVSLTAWPDGTWRGTWQPLRPQNGLVILRMAAVAGDTTLTAQSIVTGNVTASGAAPIVLSNAVFNAASQRRGNETVVPGQLITIYGANLAAQPVSAPNGVPITQLGGVQARLGSILLPLFYVGPGQINAVVPFGFPMQQAMQLTVERDGVPSVPLQMTVISAQPGIFAVNQTGTGQGAILGPSNQIADTQHPVQRGDTISIFCAGLGAVDQSVDVSKPAPSQHPLPQVTGQRVGVFIGNSSAEVLYAGLAPGYFGLYQVNARVPANAPPGDVVPVQIIVDSIVSNQATISIK